ncbi:uncharacterized protein N7483_004596 [Penicillium malachiteum]|uniref:uncharacterized protein n=1 Tax=Penicillium malachiteum TaxID=1324776 RepID=UPI00254792A3|nr:uncharacterized protein N7483_004596 [Penicillium malachiteum]KAJ5730088.1 hypothetical protein N7483_004596 [Penicillium malachiteum]
MESIRSWFTQGPFEGKYVQDAIISTQSPTPRPWKILRVINEHYNRGKIGRLSFATIRLECRQGDICAPQSPHTEIRVYLQVPYFNTELDASDKRAEQAMDFQPNEFKAYKMITADESVSQFTRKLLGYEEGEQEDWGLVPGGFHVTIVWEILPGVRLGGTGQTLRETVLET